MQLSKQIIAFALALMSSSVFCNELKDQMEIMDVAFDEITNLVDAQSDYALIEQEVETFIGAAEISKQLIPDSIKGQSQSEREAAIKHYQEMIDQLIADMRVLLENCQTGDFQHASEQIKKMKALKKQGHKEYK